MEVFGRKISAREICYFINNYVFEFEQTGDIEIFYKISEMSLGYYNSIKKIDDLYNMDVYGLEISTRAHYSLQNEGIKDIKSLLKWSESDLRKVRNLGKKSLKEIKEVLAYHGLKLSEVSKFVTDEMR